MEGGAGQGGGDTKEKKTGKPGFPMAESKGVIESHLSVLQVSGSDLKIFLGVSESSMVEMPEKYFVAIKPKGENQSSPNIPSYC